MINTEKSKLKPFLILVESYVDGNSSGEIRSCAFSAHSTTCDKTPLLRSHNQLSHPSYPSYFDDTPSVLKIPNGKVIYKKKIGEGHYGTVYLGEIRYCNQTDPIQVAIKTLKSFNHNQLNRDFMREIQIMQV